MSRLSEQLDAGRFVVTAEIAPPKGIDLGEVFCRADRLAGLDAVNVTDNQGACMRMTPLVIAGRLVERGIEPILQMTCRDRNRMALQSDLLGAAALGVENLLLLTGDHPYFGDHCSSRPVFDLDSVQLLGCVELLQQGRDMADRLLAGAPQFFPGAAAAPGAEPVELAFSKLVKKKRSGARFFQTQTVFTRHRLEQFCAMVKEIQVPVIFGVLLLKDARMATYLNEAVPGIQVPDEIIRRLSDAADPLGEGIAIAREMTSWAREFCQEVHLMTFGREDLIPDILSG